VAKDVYAWLAKQRLSHLMAG